MEDQTHITFHDKLNTVLLACMAGVFAGSALLGIAWKLLEGRADFLWPGWRAMLELAH